MGGSAGAVVSGSGDGQEKDDEKNDKDDKDAKSTAMAQALREQSELVEELQRKLVEVERQREATVHVLEESIGHLESKLSGVEVRVWGLAPSGTRGLDGKKKKSDVLLLGDVVGRGAGGAAGGASPLASRD